MASAVVSIKIMALVLAAAMAIQPQINNNSKAETDHSIQTKCLQLFNNNTHQTEVTNTKMTRKRLYSFISYIQ